MKRVILFKEENVPLVKSGDRKNSLFLLFHRILRDAACETWHSGAGPPELQKMQHATTAHAKQLISPALQGASFRGKRRSSPNAAHRTLRATTKNLGVQCYIFSSSYTDCCAPPPKPPLSAECSNHFRRGHSECTEPRLRPPSC